MWTCHLYYLSITDGKTKETHVFCFVLFWNQTKLIFILLNKTPVYNVFWTVVSVAIYCILKQTQSLVKRVSVRTALHSCLSPFLWLFQGDFASFNLPFFFYLYLKYFNASCWIPKINLHQPAPVSVSYPHPSVKHNLSLRVSQTLI